MSPPKDRGTSSDRRWKAQLGIEPGSYWWEADVISIGQLSTYTHDTYGTHTYGLPFNPILVRVREGFVFLKLLFLVYELISEMQRNGSHVGITATNNIIMWSEFACPANQYPEKHNQEKMSLYLCTPPEFPTKCVCHVW